MEYARFFLIPGVFPLQFMRVSLYAQVRASFLSSEIDQLFCILLTHFSSDFEHLKTYADQKKILLIFSKSIKTEFLCCFFQRFVFHKMFMLISSELRDTICYTPCLTKT